jgi:hypothetical protein
MASGYARSDGANARAIDWESAEPAPKRRGNWLQLDALDADESGYAPSPRIAQTGVAPRPQWARQAAPGPATAAYPRTAQHPQQRQAARPQPQINVGQLPIRKLCVVAGLAVASLAAYVGVSSALDWAKVKMDDMQYGRPRTVQMAAYVGHNEAEGMPSHFVAMNLNRRVTILQLQGGDPTKLTTIVGPYLFGQGEDLTPVQLDARDANVDGKPDLVVSVKSEQLLYLNDGANFRLATPEERAAIGKAAQTRQLDATAPKVETGEAQK